MSEALPLVESGTSSSCAIRRAACCRTPGPHRAPSPTVKDAAALKDMWRKAALRGWTALAPSPGTRWDLLRPSC